MFRNVQKKKQTFQISKVVASCSMVTLLRFQVKTSNFHTQLIEAFKSIPSKLYDPQTKCWTFLFTDYKHLLMKMNLLRPDIIVESLPFNVVSLMEQQYEENIDIDSTRIEAILWDKLYQFQKEGVRFGIEKDGKCMIADEMGLGKTIQALALASYYKDDWPLLIATTASVKNTWYQKCLEYLPSVPIHHIVCMASAKEYIDDAKILIVTHNLLEKCLDSLRNRFGVIIYDESHTLKNFKAKCTNAALVLAKAAKRIILLTGTPALSRPNELFTQLCMLDEKFFVNFKEYSKRYCDGKETNFGWNSSGCSNLPELNIILNKKFMIRRTKDEVLPELNDINREVIVLDSKHIITSASVELDLNLLANAFIKDKRDNENAALLSYFADTAKYKYKAVCSYIKEMIHENQDQKFLIFCHHKIMIESICDLLNDEKIYHIKIDGNIKSDVRTKLVENFQTKRSCRAAILSITSANAGITLTAAQLVIFAELHWTPSIMAQAEARAHRIGQMGSVRVQYLIAKGTADDIIWPMLQNKQGVLNKIGLCNDNYGDTNTKQMVNKALESQKEKFKEYFSPGKSKSISENATHNELLDAQKENIEDQVHEASFRDLLMDDNDDIFMNVNLDF